MSEGSDLVIVRRGSCGTEARAVIIQASLQFPFLQVHVG
jgi:hypothetical protein